MSGKCNKCDIEIDDGKKFCEKYSRQMKVQDKIIIGIMLLLFSPFFYLLAQAIIIMSHQENMSR